MVVAIFPFLVEEQMYLEEDIALLFVAIFNLKATKAAKCV